MVSKGLKNAGLGSEQTTTLALESRVDALSSSRIAPAVSCIHPSPPAEFCSTEIAAKASAMRGGACGRAYIRFM
jgi:hypothetical protein